MFLFNNDNQIGRNFVATKKDFLWSNYNLIFVIDKETHQNEKQERIRLNKQISSNKVTTPSWKRPWQPRRQHPQGMARKRNSCRPRGNWTSAFTWVNWRVPEKQCQHHQNEGLVREKAEQALCFKIWHTNRQINKHQARTYQKGASWPHRELSRLKSPYFPRFPHPASRDEHEVPGSLSQSHNFVTSHSHGLLALVYKSEARRNRTEAGGNSLISVWAQGVLSSFFLFPL